MHNSSRLKLRYFFFYLLLAVFTANAANKFFIINLEKEAEQQFYERIFNFTGDAPDQYRILPLLGLKSLKTILQLVHPTIEFHHALLVFNAICAFLIFILFFQLLQHRTYLQRQIFILLFAILFIYTLYTGWRPDTLGLLLVCTLYAWLIHLQEMRHKQPVFSIITHVIMMLILSFSRSDIALIYALFMSFIFIRKLVPALFLITLPLLVQYLLQFYLFPDAVYYTRPLMIWDNLSGYYFIMNPTSWLIAATVLLFFSKIKGYLHQTWNEAPVLIGLLVFYILLVFVVGRINEYRLYLPFLPLFMLIDRRLHLTSHPASKK